MKKIIIILSIVFVTQMTSYGQIADSKSFWTNSRVELSGCYGLFKGGIGFVLKGKKELFNAKHFEGFAGIAFQYSYYSETDKFLNGVDGYIRDIGTNLIVDIVYYPFNKNKLFLGTEPFIGLTNLKSKGTLKLPDYNVDNRYTNSCTYINYGFTETIGYDFGRISTGIFAMMHLKGVLDKGRNRLGDFDSKIFVGISLSYKLRPSE